MSSIAAVNSFPIIAPLAFDTAAHDRPAERPAAGSGSGAAAGFDAPPRDGSRSRRETFEHHARGSAAAPRPAPGPAHQTRNRDLLSALIGQMGGGPVPTGKGIYIDVRV